MDRLHAQLSRFEDAFPGFLTEIVEGSVVATPVTPHHGRTIQQLWATVERQLPSDWGLVSDVAFPFDDAHEFCPDLAVIPAPAGAENRIAYQRGLYASRGIANYLILDPLKGHCVTMWNPGPDGYRGRDTIPYGTDVAVDYPLGKLTIRTAHLPVGPKARPQA
ncbi:Uma2 family endonuclease [Streptomyces sp. NPDC050548]|uniref:Uma2 family endonuclease n=1 Tax=Streptomyces sp. NPDC050548 TaxID=3365629 RepID=UPI0037A0AB5B